MKWLFCASSGNVVGENESAVKKAPVVVRSGKPGAPQLDLVKQDSAFLQGPDAKPVDKFDNRISQEYSTSLTQDGAAASFKVFGPPKPICNAARLANIEELGVMRRPKGDPQIQHVMQLMCTVFKTESALVALVGDESIYIHDAINFKTGDFAWRQSFCAHSLTPPNHQVMVVENAKEDARFKHLPMVRGEDGCRRVGSYMGTPIVSSKGHRLGTVCFACPEPRKFDAETCNMLTNMGELITREMEREWATQQQNKALTSKAQDEPKLLRAIECYSEAVMFIDTSAPKWRIMHMNAAAETRMKLFGVKLDLTSAEVNVWDLFEPNSAAEPDWEELAENVKAGRKFEVSSVRLSTRGHSNSAPMPVFGMTFRCAANNVVDSNTPLVGTPAYLPMTESNHNYYFVTLSHMHGSYSRGSLNSFHSLVSGAVDVDSVPFDDLELGPLLGKGGYGRVYRGLRDGEVLAVKIIENSSNSQLVDGQPLEAVICRDAQHPNIVRTIASAVTSANGDASSESSSEKFDSAHSKQRRKDQGQVWMLMEFCDRGCLQEASDKGLFLRDGTPDMRAILSVAHDVAAGMAFLHERGVAHGDLTGGNVLLASNPDSPAGVTAKIADFGLARAVDVQSRIETRTYGTVTHMPPELLVRGIFTKAADTFALGVLLWEMYHGVRAWSSMSHAQIITAVAVNRRSLKFRAGAPEGYVGLATSLMCHDPDLRPSFNEALECIEKLQASLA